MGTIKLRRGSGSPAGSLAQYEVAMDVAAKNLYTSTDGSDAVILADNTLNTLSALPDDTMTVSGSAQNLDDAVINIVTDNTGYNKAHIMCEDSNGKAFSMVGEMDNVNQKRDKFIVTLDPDNVNSPTNQANYAGDYGVYYLKEYGDIEDPAIEMNVFGAKDAFKLRIYDDNNGGSPNPGPLGGGGYGFKPMEVHCESFQVMAKDSDTSTDMVLKVDDNEVLIDDTELVTKALSFSTVAKHQRITTNTTNRTKAGHAVQHNIEDVNGGFVAPTTGAGSSTGWMVNGGFLGSLNCELVTVAVDVDNRVDSPNSKAEFKIKLYTDGANQQTGDTILTASHDALKSGKPFENVSLSADPSNPVNGWQYYNDQTHKLRLYANGAWVDLN